MLKFSANLSMLFTERPLAERFSAARSAGFSAVEIQFPYELDIATLRRLLTENRLELVLINVAAGDLMQGGDGLACVPGKEAGFRAAVMQACEYAHALSVPTINLLAGRQPSGISRDSCVEVLLENMAHAASAIKASGATPVAEAINIFDMPRFLVHSLHDMHFLCEHIDGLKMQFDCYHMSRMGEGALKALRDNLPLVGHVQFADNPGRHEPGSGDIEYERIFPLLRDSAYAGWCGAEYQPSSRTEDTLGWLEKWQH